MAALSGVNWEISDLELTTRASHPWVWWALGERGVEELTQDLGKDNGLRRFGYRLGALARRLAFFLQPRTIVFSGGYVSRYWRWLAPGVRRELEGLLVAGEAPAVVATKPAEPALTGLAQLALQLD